jgi:hypothetical protein
LVDLTSGSVATTSANPPTISNCMSGTVTVAKPPDSMGGVVGALSDPACMNTGIAGGTLRVTTLFFCVIGHYHAGDTVTLTLWRGNQQMNVQVVLDTAPPPATATGAATTGAVAPTTASSGPTATPSATSEATTAPTMAETLPATPVATP